MLYLQEHHHIIRETVRGFVKSVVAPKAKEIDQTCEFPLDTMKQMAELGLLGVPFPEEYGGAGMDNLAQAIVMEEVARDCASTALTIAAHVSLGTFPIYAFGTEEQKRRWVPKLASGQMLGAFGLTEPGAGSDAQGIATTAVRDGKHFVVNGAKMYCTNGGYAGTIVFTAVTGRKAGGRPEITAFVVEKGTPGLVVGKQEKKLGMRASDTRMIHFEDCRVPIENVLGGLEQVGVGFANFMKTLEGGASASARSASAARWARSIARCRTPGSVKRSAGPSATSRASASNWPTWRCGSRRGATSSITQRC